MPSLTALAAALIFVLSLGCSTTPTAPTPGIPRGPRSGTWIGTVTDPANGNGALRVDLDELVIGEAQSVLNGTWTTTFSDATKNGAGEVAGSISGTTAQLILRRAVPLSCANPGLVPAVYGSVPSRSTWRRRGRRSAAPMTFRRAAPPCAGRSRSPGSDLVAPGRALGRSHGMDEKR